MIGIIRRSHEVKARKDHQCRECGRKIAKGDLHMSGTYKDDVIFTTRQHKRCAEFQEQHGDYFYDYCEGSTEPIWNWERGILPDEVEKERMALLGYSADVAEKVDAEDLKSSD